MRHQLGLTRPRIVLPIPCPQCDVASLVRTVDVRRDWIECGACDTVIDERFYRFYTDRYLCEATRSGQGTAATEGH